MKWGKRAGAWGKGPEGLQERKKEEGSSRTPRERSHSAGRAKAGKP